MKPKNTHNFNGKRIEQKKMHLSVKLTNSELLERSKELAKATQDLDSAENDKKSAMSQFTADMNIAKSVIGRISNTISSGEEMREVECEYRFSDEPGYKELVRLDTFQVVRSEMLTDADRQLKLELDAAEESANTEPTEP